MYYYSKTFLLFSSNIANSLGELKRLIFKDHHFFSFNRSETDIKTMQASYIM